MGISNRNRKKSLLIRKFAGVGGDRAWNKLASARRRNRIGPQPIRSDDNGSRYSTRIFGRNATGTLLLDHHRHLLHRGVRLSILTCLCQIPAKRKNCQRRGSILPRGFPNIIYSVLLIFLAEFLSLFSSFSTPLRFPRSQSATWTRSRSTWLKRCRKSAVQYGYLIVNTLRPLVIEH